MIRKTFYHLSRRSKTTTKIACLLESTILHGGVKVVFRQAEALEARGYNVTVICNEHYPEWLKPGIGFVRQDPFDKNISRRYDYVITTGVRLMAFHYNHQNRAKLMHLCQGYEGIYEAAKLFIDEIEDAYRLEIHRITISKQLSQFLKQKFLSKNVF